MKDFMPCYAGTGFTEPSACKLLYTCILLNALAQHKEPS